MGLITTGLKQFQTSINKVLEVIIGVLCRSAVEEKSHHRTGHLETRVLETAHPHGPNITTLNDSSFGVEGNMAM
jgi:hypothetical protein